MSYFVQTIRSELHQSLAGNYKKDRSSLNKLHKWIQEQKDASNFSFKQIPFNNMNKWNFDRQGTLRHETGKFFSVESVKIIDRHTGDKVWQPIINQPEHGILGIISQVRNGVLYFLMQAKIEPGNIGRIQLSPTVQATKSNYLKAHKGSSVPYVEYFLNNSLHTKTCIKQLQSEHGYKFFRKANYNIIIEVDPEVEIPISAQFRWLTLREILLLLQEPHIINMDSRSVLSALSFTNVSNKGIALDVENDHATELLLSTLSLDLDRKKELLKWLKSNRKKHRYKTVRKSLSKIFANGWKQDKEKIYSDKNPDFELINLEISVKGREVTSWTQPIVKDSNPKLNGFLVKKIDGVYQLLIQLCEEACSYHGVELGPTVHNWSSITGPQMTPFLEYFQTENQNNLAVDVLYDCVQSEEGGRFFQQFNRYAIVHTKDSFKTPSGYTWLTIGQLKAMLHETCAVNIEARSLLACLPLIKIYSEDN